MVRKSIYFNIHTNVRTFVNSLESHSWGFIYLPYVFILHIHDHRYYSFLSVLPPYHVSCQEWPLISEYFCFAVGLRTNRCRANLLTMECFS